MKVTSHRTIKKYEPNIKPISVQLDALPSYNHVKYQEVLEYGITKFRVTLWVEARRDRCEARIEVWSKAHDEWRPVHQLVPSAIQSTWSSAPGEQQDQGRYKADRDELVYVGLGVVFT